MNGDVKMIIDCGYGNSGRAERVGVVVDCIPTFETTNVEIYGIEKSTLGWEVSTNVGYWNVDSITFRYINDHDVCCFHEVEQETTANYFIERYKLRQEEVDE